MPKMNWKNFEHSISIIWRILSNSGIDSTKIQNNKGKNIVEPLETGQNKYTFSDPEISNILTEPQIDRSKSNNNFDDNFKINLENKLKEIINFSDLITSNNNITIEEVRAAINKLNNLSAPEPDRICILLIKEGSKKLLNLIKNILNQTYNIGCYTKDWKNPEKIHIMTLSHIPQSV